MKPSKVILIVLDGCRPDALIQAHTPHIDALWQSGAYTWSACSVAPSYTLPAHMSMFRGVSPLKHGVNGNVFQAAIAGFPSIIDLAHQAGLTTAMFYSWEELRDLSAPGSLNLSYYQAIRTTENTDQIVAEIAAAQIVAEQPDLALVYLHSPDTIGHLEGWMSPAYMTAIERVDYAVGSVITALEQARLRDGYTVLLLADHGGHDREHGSDSPEDLTIPWIANGPGIKCGHAIQSPVNIVDTAATVAHLLALTRPDTWEGQPILDAFDD